MAYDSSTAPNSKPLYEKEVQDYLAENLVMLGHPQLELIQTEFPVSYGSDQGRIDILARDASGSVFVIEIKRGVAGRDSVGQLQSYMGCMTSEFPGKPIKGILVAADLDGPARAAMIFAPIKFFKFTTHFEFHPEGRTQAEVALEKVECRTNYWEPLGGTITDMVYPCPNCNKLTKVVRVGGLRLCGLCGKPAK